MLFRSQGREHFEASWNHPQGEAARALLLPLLAGGGWEGVKLLIFGAKSDPTPTLPCKQGREHFEARWRRATGCTSALRGSRQFLRVEVAMMVAVEHVELVAQVVLEFFQRDRLAAATG